MPGVALVRADGQCRFGWKQRDRVCRQENESRVLVVGRSKDVSRFLHRDGVSVEVLCVWLSQLEDATRDRRFSVVGLKSGMLFSFGVGVQVTIGRECSLRGRK